MTEFTASNGIRVRIDTPYLDLKHEGAGWHGIGGSSETQALREFFQHERDEINGWWRSDGHPGFVVSPSAKDTVVVLDERDGSTLHYRRNGMTLRDVAGRSPRAAAAAAYFEEHPARNPWDNAEAGEVWELTYEQLGEPSITRPFTVNSFGRFLNTSGVRMGDMKILDARRIWPEEKR